MGGGVDEGEGKTALQEASEPGLRRTVFRLRKQCVIESPEPTDGGVK